MSARRRLGIVLLSGGLAVGGCGLSNQGSESLSEAAPAAGPIATVSVTPLRWGRIEETLLAYGEVVAAPGETEVFSVPFECRVLRILVAEGMEITPDTPLVELEASPDTRLQFEQAHIERDSLAEAQKFAERRVELKLATQQDLLLAQQQLRNAEARLRSMAERGVDNPRAIRASSSGVVSRIAAQPGQVVPAGFTLVETVGRDKIVVRLGVENEDVVHLAPGRPVRLVRVNMPDQGSIDGVILAITQQVDPITRLVDLFVTPSGSTRLLLNEYVEGQIVTTSQQALIAPRAAVLPEGGDFVLYTIDSGRAARHIVTVGVENADEVEVIADGLKEGQEVVVVGNPQLADGMSVSVTSR